MRGSNLRNRVALAGANLGQSSGGGFWFLSRLGSAPAGKFHIAAGHHELGRRLEIDTVIHRLQLAHADAGAISNELEIFTWRNRNYPRRIALIARDALQHTNKLL